MVGIDQALSSNLITAEIEGHLDHSPDRSNPAENSH
jgi:hypothetical protein